MDYTGIRWTPVINCVVKYKRKILVVQRSAGMRLYPNRWNGVSGFLDDKRSLQEKVCDELREELGLRKQDIVSIRLGEIFHQDSPKYKKTWIVHPVLVIVDTDQIRLDWEAQDFKWVYPEEAKELNLLPGFDRVLKSVLRKTRVK